MAQEKEEDDRTSKAGTPDRGQSSMSSVTEKEGSMVLSIALRRKAIEGMKGRSSSESYETLGQDRGSCNQAFELTR
jgi:hypothetical protein